MQYEEFPFLEKDTMMDYSSMQRLGAKLGLVIQFGKSVQNHDCVVIFNYHV